MATGAIKLSIGLIDGMLISTVPFARHSSRDSAVSESHQIDTKQLCSALYSCLKTALREVLLWILLVENMKQRFTELRQSYQAQECPQTHGLRQRDVRFLHGNRACGTVEICIAGRLGGEKGTREAEFPLRTAYHELHQSRTRRSQTQSPYARVGMSSDKSLIRRVLIVAAV